MDWINWIIGFLRDLTTPATLNEMATSMGLWLDAVLFGIVFCETGLVILPFLPGDSLLFAVGAVGSLPGSTLNLPILGIVLVAAAVIGDAVNYAIGKRIGPRIFASETSRLLNKKHLQEAHNFYEKYGAKTIILARFVPIIRTFAPFVAGIGKMSYPKFALYNITGAILWVGLLMLAGRLFAGFEFVQKHFESVIVAIIVISVLPAVIEVLRARYGGKETLARPAAELVTDSRPVSVQVHVNVTLEREQSDSPSR